MFEDVQYTKISAYWDDLFVAGILPIFVVAFLNLQTCLKVSIISIHFNNTKELKNVLFQELISETINLI